MDEPVVILCPTCGAECTSEATFCGTCGSALLQTPAREPDVTAPLAPIVAEAEAAPVAEPPAAAGQVVEPAAAPVEARPAQAASASGTGRRCNWCGTESPADAARCVQCGAMFPTPETDAAYQAAAEQRLRSVQESLDQMRRNWRRRGIGRLFED